MMKTIILGFAGGCVRQVTNIFSDQIVSLSEKQLISIEYPGHPLQMHQPLMTNSTDLIQYLSSTIIQKCKNEDFQIVGYSMGATLIPFISEVLNRLGYKPKKLILLSADTPFLEKLYKIDTKSVLSLLIKSGLPSSIQQNKKARDFFITVMKSDLEILNDLSNRIKNTPLSIGDINTFFISGQDDPNTSRNFIYWKSLYPKAKFRTFPGGHFFAFDPKNNWNDYFSSIL